MQRLKIHVYIIRGVSPGSSIWLEGLSLFLLMFDVLGPELGGPWVIQFLSTGISIMGCLFSIEEQLYNLDTGL